VTVNFVDPRIFLKKVFLKSLCYLLGI